VNAARLVSLAGGEAYFIGAVPLTIGREPSSDVPVHNEDVSRRHAYVLRTPQGFLLVDSSLHGTFLNGKRVQLQCILHDGDVVGVGHLSFRFDQRAEDLGAAITGKVPLALSMDQRTSWKEWLGSWLKRFTFR